MTRRLFHVSLSESLRRQITAGAFRPGERLPSIRQLARQTRLSVTTVIRALQTLEDEGLVEGRPRSGYAVRHSPATAISHANRLYLPLTPSLAGLAGKVHQFQREVTNPGLVPLGRAIPPEDLIPRRALATMIRAELRTGSIEAMHYQVPPGHVLLREQLAKRAMAWGCPLRPNDFVVTVGCTEAVHLALTAITRPGDTIAVESPTFFGTLQMLASLRLKPLEIPADAQGLDLDILQRALRRRPAGLLTVPSFNNPSGGLQSQARRQQMVNLAQQHGVPVIEVDLYGDLHHDGRRPWAAKRYDRADSVLLCGSFSKTLAPGLRVGWIAPGRYYDRVVAAQLSSTYATPTLPSAALGRFLKEGGFDRFLRRAREVYRERMSVTTGLLRKYLPDDCRISQPEGGYLLWVQLPRRADSWALYREARRRGFSIAPGELFSARGSYNHCFRVHGGLPLNPRLQEAIQLLGLIIASKSKTSQRLHRAMTGARTGLAP